MGINSDGCILDDRPFQEVENQDFFDPSSLPFKSSTFIKRETGSSNSAVGDSSASRIEEEESEEKPGYVSSSSKSVTLSEGNYGNHYNHNDNNSSNSSIKKSSSTNNYGDNNNNKYYFELTYQTITEAQHRIHKNNQSILLDMHPTNRCVFIFVCLYLSLPIHCIVT